MNILKDFTLKWWQAGIFKIALLSLGIIIGSTWPELFRGWTPFPFLKRVVLSLTEKGKIAFNGHEAFHCEMDPDILKEIENLSEDHIASHLEIIRKVGEHLKRYIARLS